MAWFTAIASVLGQGLKLANKFVPSREEKAGRAMAERDTLKESADARKKMDSVEPSSKSDAVDRMRKDGF